MKDALRSELIVTAHWVADQLTRSAKRRVAKEPDPEHRIALRRLPIPEQPAEPGSLLPFVERTLAPYPGGAGHPAGFASPGTGSTGTRALAGLLRAALDDDHETLPDLAQGVVRSLAGLAGLQNTTGRLTASPTAAHLLCLATARDRQPDRDLVLYRSTEADPSIDEAARLAGIRRIRPVPVDRDRRLDPEALRLAIKRDQAVGLRPFCVVSTIGTPATGAIDPLPEITALCRAFKLWQHADGSLGGFGGLVPELAPLYRGIDEVDSLTVDPHRALGGPPGCAAALSATTLPTLGSAGERALELWATLRLHGRIGAAELVAERQDLGHQLRDLIANHPGLVLHSVGPLPIACFGFPDEQGDPSTRSAFHEAVACRIRQRGRSRLSTVDLDGHTVLRACIGSRETTKRELDLLLDEVLAAGRELETAIKLLPSNR
ncbi:aspartate aminotransferase family protein [Pseudonocardiaceae bacterium YIM PH 21723]|nr:aspartate aminotransferase family protein [Pseudonocardiaceae bacterium YIM PH 21723]